MFGGDFVLPASGSPLAGCMPGRAPIDTAALAVIALLGWIYDNETAIRAFALLRHEFPACRMSIAGIGPEQERLRRRVGHARRFRDALRPRPLPVHVDPAGRHARVSLQERRVLAPRAGADPAGERVLEQKEAVGLQSRIEARPLYNLGRLHRARIIA